jgi:hypothetical protein
MTTRAGGGEFEAWRDQWQAVAEYDGATVPDCRDRVERIIRLWEKTIPGDWQRGIDKQLLEKRYRRGDAERARPAEHEIEHEILCEHFDEISCFGWKLIDGVNQFPLAQFRNGVLADIVLLAERKGEHRMFLCEVKERSNNPWYATVECLRQLRLFLSNSESRAVFRRRRVVLDLPLEIPVTALIVAPEAYYSNPGKRANAVGPANDLASRFAAELQVDIRLAVWDRSRREIRDLQRATQ